MTTGMDGVRPGGDPSDRATPARLVSVPYVERATEVLTAVGVLLALLALAVLAVRAAVRLDLRWDTFMYQMPFAAIRGGLNVPYELSDDMYDYFLGFPPLAHFLQGALWRLTGSINATGVINFVAFAAFLAFCHLKLRARFWLVGLIALTAPMILIHSAVSYIDLFGNSLLAIGVSAFVYMFLFDQQHDRTLLVCGVLGLVGAAWSKYQMVAVAALFLMLFLLTYATPTGRAVKNRREILIFISGAILVAALPYLKNWFAYGNPFWPVRVPIVGELLPYKPDLRYVGVPYPFDFAMSRFEIFFSSLFEFGLPTSDRTLARWNIDQSHPWIPLRRGGFWNVAVVVNLLSVLVMGIVHNVRKGLWLALGGTLLLCFVAALPGSNLLRYYLFIPLCLAATIGMLFPALQRKHARIALCQLALVTSLFVYMARMNWPYYAIEKVDYVVAADVLAVAGWWQRLSPDTTYCVVDMVPTAMLMTGPTMSEFHIIDRSHRVLCPEDSVVIERGSFVD